MKKLPILIIVFFLISCKYLIAKKYKINRKFNFENKNVYIDFLRNEYDFKEKDVYFLDSSSYSQFLENFDGTIYFGSFINDSIQVSKSEYLKNNQACIGRMEHEITGILENLSSISKYDSSINLTNYSIYHISDKKKLTTADSKLLTIVIIYSFSNGTYFNRLYDEIVNVHKLNMEKCDLKIISVDPIYKFQ